MPDTDEIKFRCTIKKMYNNCPKDDGWFGCFAHIANQNEDITLIGKTYTNLTDGMQLDVIAKPSTKYDNAYDVIDFSVVTKTKKGMVSYLSSLPGISRVVASRIVSEYGNNTLNIIKNNIDLVKNKLDLSDKQVQNLINGVNSNSEQNELHQFLPELSAQMIKRVRERLVNPKTQIMDNPYILHTIPGISFPTADTIAIRLGVDPVSEFRVNHGLVYLLETKSSSDLYINLSNNIEINKLYNQVEDLLRIRFSGLQEFGARLMSLSKIKNSPIIIDVYNGEYHLYLTETYNSMILFSNHIKYLNNTAISKYNELMSHKNISLKDSISDYESQKGMCLTQEQKIAVKTSLKNKVSIITGGPGRGKTSVVDCLAQCWPGNVLLLAPTGKAAHKLKTATGARFTTMTIDKLIVTMSHTKNKKLSNLNSNETLIIIDESSMIDVSKIANLIAFTDCCQICFVGDIDQLPPISPGHILKDMISSGSVPTSYLTIPLRNGGLILSNADKINANDINLQYDFNQMPFYPQDEDDQKALDNIIEQYNDERENCPDITQIALLCPVRKGVVGTVNLNITIQNIACPLNDAATSVFDNQRLRHTYTTKGFPIPNTIYGNASNYTRFRVGDIVMCTKNTNDIETFIYSNNDYWNGRAIDRGQGIFNGDCGRIIEYIPGNSLQNDDDSHDKITVQFFDNRIATLDIVAGEFEVFDLGYALTVHKSQGCEYNTVIYVSPKSLMHSTKSGFANKNLVYTAVTRAKQRVVIMGSKDSLNACIQNNTPIYNSNIADRLK